MPCRLDNHILAVDTDAIHKVNTGDPATVYSMLTVFFRCGDSIEQGQRLKNLSWRIWPTLKKETFVVDNEEKTQNMPFGLDIYDLPQLFGTVGSLEDEEAVDVASGLAPLGVASRRVRGQGSCVSTQSRCDDFEKVIVSIVKDKGPLSGPPHVAPVTKDSLPAPPAFERSSSPTTESQSPAKSITASEGSPQPSPQSMPRTTVVRGFTVSLQIPDADRSSTKPAPKSSPAAQVVQLKKPARFALGGSCSSSEHDQSLSNNNSKPIKKPAFQIGGSSEEDGSLKSAIASSQSCSLLSAPKNQASFGDNVMTRTVDHQTVVDPDTDDYIDEDAIDEDDDSSDWEDSTEDNSKPSMDGKLFQRLDVNRNLTSRRSLITLMLAQNDDAHNRGNDASKSAPAISRFLMADGPSLGASPNDSDEAPLMMKGMRDPGLKPIPEVLRSSAQPIMTGPNHIQPQAALSPRTTRRNMRATEITESLRRHLRRERQDKSLTANAVLRRGRTSQDVANMKQDAERPCMKKSEDVNASSWNHYISEEVIDGYHCMGW
ncbi:hypothetical protein AU210_016374 [Fusarium oxysporum f. sp. radicis-cucumerinum]|uniref:Uncharacterized protein n=1 Tax=Fusarium oxysporum f. sp. radicis-cucumerinum TaxID=327505 RepID=A0A2H3G8K0_FUSOX|nr:hypothetical protein AU210_016374 [Fusarium oxysporum f. sp. radicis-cucumerinum]